MTKTVDQAEGVKKEILTFAPTKSLTSETEVQKLFAAMKNLVEEQTVSEGEKKPRKTPPLPDKFHEVGLGSGSHLLKLNTPRAGVGQSVLRIGNDLLPSVNAPLIPVAKVAHRPIDYNGTVKSLAQRILEQQSSSDTVLRAFESVFGAPCLDALRSGLTATLTVTSLATELPVVFVPHPQGGDLQITPVSPAASYMGM